jgi:hypothetical protein
MYSYSGIRILVFKVNLKLFSLKVYNYFSDIFNNLTLSEQIFA